MCLARTFATPQVTNPKEKHIQISMAEKIRHAQWTFLRLHPFSKRMRLAHIFT